MAGFVVIMKGLGRGVAQIARSLPVLGWTVVALMAVVLVLLATCSHYSAKEADQAKREAEARAKALDDAREADTRAADRRVWEFKVNQDKQKELNDAIQTFPDAVPSPVQRRLACERLRHQGTRTEDLPAVCRSNG